MLGRQVEDSVMSMKKRFAFLPAALLLASGGALAQNDKLPSLPFDTPQSMRDFEAVCTGIGSDARNDPRWAE